MRRILSAVMLLILASSVNAQTVAKRDVPDEESRKAAEKVVEETYRPDIEKAKTPVQRIILAKRFLNDGSKTKEDEVARFVIWNFARLWAVEQGDLATAFDAISRMSQDFDVKIHKLQAVTAETAVKVPKASSEHLLTANLLLPHVREAIAAEKYEYARSFAESALYSARQAKVPLEAKKFESLLAEVNYIATEFDAIKELTVTLESKPTDPQANFAVGKFQCYAKGDWDRGIGKLALGELEAAMLEFEEPPNSERIGHAWLAVADNLEGTAKTRVQQRAAQHLRVAVGTLEGLEKRKVERILEQLPNAVPAAELAAMAPLPAKSPAGSSNAPTLHRLLEADTLNGFYFKGKPPYNWSINDGVLSHTTSTGSEIITKERFVNIDMKFEFMLSKSGNSGVIFRGYELEIIEPQNRVDGKQDVSKWSLGSIFNRIAPSRPPPYQGPDKWNKCAYKSVNDVITVEINDVVIIDRKPLEKSNTNTAPRADSVSFQGFGNTIRYRNIVIRSIP